MKKIQKSNKLNNVCYDIRGPILHTVAELEEHLSLFVAFQSLAWQNARPFARGLVKSSVDSRHRRHHHHRRHSYPWSVVVPIPQ